MSDECMICIETITGKRKAVDCPSCTKPMTVCVACTKTYLLGSPQHAHCMTCKGAWSNTFLHNTFTKSWLTGEYRKSRQQIALEREKSLLPTSLPLVDEAKRKQKVEKDITELRNRERQLKEELRRVREDIWLLNMQRDNPNLVRDNEGEIVDERKDKKSYMFPCPAEECRGYIESLKWKCGLCDTKICKSCHVIKKQVLNKKGEPVKHVCNQDDVKTAKMVVEETKPCPACKTRIFKIEGCNMMFCTACNTAFDWKTGNIHTKNIHNPHYFELQQRLGGYVPRNILDVPCGGIRGDFIRWITDHEIASEYNAFRLRVGEINQRIEMLVDKDFSDIRVNYLIGKIESDKDFRATIFRRERLNEKMREERQILETFRVAVIERFRDLEEKVTPRGRRLEGTPENVRVRRNNEVAREKLDELHTILDFCNQAFKENYTILGYKAIPEIQVFEVYN